MKCGEIASRPVLTVTPDVTLEEAVEILAGHDVGLLVVVDKENPKKVVGVLSERDVVRTIAGKAPLTVTVDKVATTHSLIYVYVDDPVEAAAEKMAKYGVRHVVVLDKNGELYGVISIRDLLKRRVAATL
ncbi:MAG: CBS domain-containing protein [Pyrobaculum sp.]